MSAPVSIEQFRKMEKPRRSKYGNRITVVDGIKFHSAKEAKRWGELKLLERNGDILKLERQREFKIEHNGELICKYRSDFSFIIVEKNILTTVWKMVVEDVKGAKRQRVRDKRTGKMKTISNAAYEMFLLKKRLMKVLMGIEVKEI